MILGLNTWILIESFREFDLVSEFGHFVSSGEINASI